MSEEKSQEEQQEDQLCIELINGLEIHAAVARSALISAKVRADKLFEINVKSTFGSQEKRTQSLTGSIALRSIISSALSSLESIR